MQESKNLIGKRRIYESERGKNRIKEAGTVNFFLCKKCTRFGCPILKTKNRGYIPQFFFGDNNFPPITKAPVKVFCICTGVFQVRAGMTKQRNQLHKMTDIQPGNRKPYFCSPVVKFLDQRLSILHSVAAILCDSLSFVGG